MSNIGLMIFIIILPTILIMLLVNSKDKNKEPINLLIQLFIMGMLSCLLALGISLVLDKVLPFMNNGRNTKEFVSIFMYSFIGIALIEEICKWIVLYLLGYRSKHFDELYDVIIYSVFIALGFSLFENILFIINENNLSIYTIILRAIIAVPGHTCYGIFMGYYLSLSKRFKCKNQLSISKNNMMLSITVPVILHGIYDLCLLLDNKIFTIIFAGYMVALIIISYQKVKIAIDSNKKIINKDIYCKNCGTKVETDFCPYCGKKIDK